jgi:hypothetical protein
MKHYHVFALVITLLLTQGRVVADQGEMATPEALVPSAATSCPSRFFISADGIAFSHFPSSSTVSRAVNIGPETVAGKVCWTATSSAAWLSVKPYGPTALLLSAQPLALQKDTVHLASVTVKALTSGYTGQIRVALWVGSSDPGTVTLAHSAVAIAANPVEPFAYVGDGSASVAVFNVYTGQLVRTFNPVAPAVGALVVSSDGTRLFAVDTTNYQIVAVNAATGKIQSRFQLAGPISSDFSFAYARPTGKPTLLAPGQAAIDVASGKAVSSPIINSSGFYDPLMVATPSGSTLAVVERGLSPGSLYTFKVTAAAAGELTIRQVGSTTIQGENCQALAINSDGSRLYPACGWPYEFDVYDGTTLKQVQTLKAVAYPNNAVVNSEGEFVGGVNGLYETDDVFVFNTQGYPVGVVPTTPASNATGQGNNLLATSGDSTRVISATAAVYGSQTLMFRPLP